MTEEATAIPNQRKVAILGTALSTVELAPVQDLSWELWACSPFFTNKLPRFTRFYEIHWQNQFFAEERQHYFPWMSGFKEPIIVFDDLKLPNQVFYPRREVEAHFVASQFAFTSTIAWMLAHAVYEHVVEKNTIHELGVWGVDMSTEGEYASQKPGCLHFIALAAMAQIPVVIPAASELTKIPAPYPDRLATTIATQLRSQREQADKHLADALVQKRNFENTEQFMRGYLHGVTAAERALV